MMRDERGFTLAEVLVAAVVIGIGLVAVAFGFSYATQGLETGRQQTTAVFLAEQQVERLRSVAMTSFSGTGWDTQLNAGVTNEAYNTIPNGAGYRRVTTITDSPLPVDWKRIQVRVFYRPVTYRGVLAQERQASVVTLVTRRQ